ncbi:hypothetical protein [Streptomyces hainanensis]|uniref:Cobyrinic acid a,c-diamide synthase n=1 Tax=Streptomyces hainanensis TaxID=402648 RepID=A0A4R4SMH9_9ACTN|nr:hypothetical protein [Streptomyces hainanensis]TDC64096.1 hypothetical protein E1283_31830 [Streptomyces hainanensis]
MSLPAADELFRSTGGAAVQPSTPPNAPEQAGSTKEDPAPRVPAPAGEQRPAEAGPGDEPAASPPSGGAGGAGSADDRGRLLSRDARDARPVGERTLPAQQGREREGRDGRDAAKGSRPAPAAAPRRGRAARRPSGRERHDEKITVYVSAEELMDLEHARLVLRGEHGLAVDRGRIVREAVAVVLADLESRGEASILVRRLRGR